MLWEARSAVVDMHAKLLLLAENVCRLALLQNQGPADSISGCIAVQPW